MWSSGYITFACYVLFVPLFAALGWPRRSLTLFSEVAPCDVLAGTSIRSPATAITPGGVFAAVAATRSAAVIGLSLGNGKWPVSTTFS